jgi:hypothetical protein
LVECVVLRHVQPAQVIYGATGTRRAAVRSSGLVSPNLASLVGISGGPRVIIE